MIGDDDEGLHPLAKANPTIAAAIASDEPYVVAPQHWKKRGKLGAICGAYGSNAATPGAVTCPRCKELLARRTRAA